VVDLLFTFTVHTSTFEQCKNDINSKIYGHATFTLACFVTFCFHGEHSTGPLGSLHIYIDHSILAEHHAKGEHHKPSMQFSAVGPRPNIEVLGLTIASIL